MEPTLHFGSDQVLLLNCILAIMIFGVSVTLKPADFSRVVRAPKAPLAGLFAQFVLLPALTCAFTWVLDIEPTLALGMMLVAACPGGTFSNIMTFLARGNTAVSVSMTAVSSVGSAVLTPFNFALYANLNPNTQPLLQSIAMNPVHLAGLFFGVLIIPLVLGMMCGQRWPAWARRTEPGFRVFSVVTLVGFVVVAVGQNLNTLMSYLGVLVAVVIGHNTLALLMGYLSARFAQLNEADTRAITLEVGIQNSGLALAILFTFFPNQTSMMAVAAFWGIWHLISGGLLSWLWNRKPVGEVSRVE
ncbi:bile acid:sodium symporter family protein [Simiduia sp. 21SJ11W-1]|uniref:bile acid:sodium symporter family protein n=1 Tax=Simiduia sp. 21SJ11W-1 TaxID=2909669 RepID=UPI00209F488F|nr:bile acid:sodium symporter family protein [Simiduia sp. 21SJ11W-1]UTA46874.1 bile acid:sodium symporter family protein [Simiduia sp. 21SJ11W-1]